MSAYSDPRVSPLTSCWRTSVMRSPPLRSPDGVAEPSQELPHWPEPAVRVCPLIPPPTHTARPRALCPPGQREGGLVAQARPRVPQLPVLTTLIDYLKVSVLSATHLPASTL